MTVYIGMASRLFCQRITLCVPTDTGSVEATLDTNNLHQSQKYVRMLFGNPQ